MLPLSYPAGIYLLIYLSGVVLVSLLLALNIFHTLCVSFVNFEHGIAGWVIILEIILNLEFHI